MLQERIQFFKGVKKLLPGRYLIWQNGKMKIERYWKPEFHPDESKSLEDWANEIHSTLKEIMPEVKTADEKAESFLSGGVDSSYVLAMSDVKMSDSCGYDEARFDESPLAKETADILGRENSRCRITPEAYFDIVPWVMYNMEQPLEMLQQLHLHLDAEQQQNIQIFVIQEKERMNFSADTICIVMRKDMATI